MDAETHWSLVGLAFLVTLVAYVTPGLNRRRYAVSAVAWILCGLALYAKADDWAFAVIPAIFLVALTAQKLVQPDQPD